MPQVLRLYKVLRNCGCAEFVAIAGQKIEVPVEVARPLVEAGALRELTLKEFEADDGAIQH